MNTLQVAGARTTTEVHTGTGAGSRQMGGGAPLSTSRSMPLGPWKAGAPRYDGQMPPPMSLVVFNWELAREVRREKEKRRRQRSAGTRERTVGQLAACAGASHQLLASSFPAPSPSSLSKSHSMARRLFGAHELEPTAMGPLPALATLSPARSVRVRRAGPPARCLWWLCPPLRYVRPASALSCPQALRRARNLVAPAGPAPFERAHVRAYRNIWGRNAEAQDPVVEQALRPDDRHHLGVETCPKARDDLEKAEGGWRLDWEEEGR